MSRAKQTRGFVSAPTVRMGTRSRSLPFVPTSATATAAIPIRFVTAKNRARMWSGRDFTINGLLLDPVEDEVLDFVGGRADLEAGLIRTIGDPRLRFAEDKLRMLRAVRFAARFDYEIEPATFAAIHESRFRSTRYRANVSATNLPKCLPRVMHGGHLCCLMRVDY